MIGILDVNALFGDDSDARAGVDRALMSAARDSGFVCIRGLPDAVPLGPAARRRLLGIFRLDGAQRRRLFRRKFAPENRNVYRGWFPAQPGHLTHKEGIDIGGDLAHGSGLVVAGDPLREATPLPDEASLPGWREGAAAYYRAMEHIALTLMHSLARGLGLPSGYFDAAFHEGLSTLRLLHYPPRDAAELATVSDPLLWVGDGGERRYVMGAAHTDSGFVTLLAQDGVAGLQARSRQGDWIDVPPIEGTLVVNFGQVLEHWSAGRIRATEHRVLGAGTGRHAIPFFLEARADAIIAPLPIDAPDRFEPFVFGDYLWKRITSFVEFRGMEAERAPTGPGGMR